jgi:hypothetical protein
VIQVQAHDHHAHLAASCSFLFISASSFLLRTGLLLTAAATSASIV